MKNRLVLLAALLLGSLHLLAAEPSPKANASHDAFEKLKTLEGFWQGQGGKGGGLTPSSVHIKIFRGGTVVSVRFAEDTAGETVMMIHPDGDELMGTVYGSFSNQPRMIFVPGDDPNRLVFKFRDATNSFPGNEQVNQVEFGLDGRDHHIQQWTLLAVGGERSATMRFDFRRKP